MKEIVIILCDNALVYLQNITAFKPSMTLHFASEWSLISRILHLILYTSMLMQKKKNIIESLWSVMKSKSKAELMGSH